MATSMTTNMTANTTGGETIPRLAMINDFAGFGRCSTTVSLPVISVMQVQVCPVPTSILSNHLGFPVCHFDDYTPHLQDYLHAWEQLQLTFDGLYCGFLGNVKQITIVGEFLERFHPPLFLLDPVMGDHGRTYSTITTEHIDHMKALLPHADILTPNLTEACLLTDTPYRETGWSKQELNLLCQKLSANCPGRIVITGIRQQDTILNVLWEQQHLCTYSSPVCGQSRPGTGDLFASILAADALHGRDFYASVQKAADFVGLCIRGSDAAGIPIAEGVCFEKYLGRLL